MRARACVQSTRPDLTYEYVTAAPARAVGTVPRFGKCLRLLDGAEGQRVSMFSCQSNQQPSSLPTLPVRGSRISR